MSSGKSTILITGILGRLGQLLARHLHEHSDAQIIGLDDRPFINRPKDIIYYQSHLQSQKARNIFRNHNISALIHMGIIHSPHIEAEEHYDYNIEGTRSLLDYCSSYDVPKIIVLSSANVYGPRPENPQFLTEDSPLLGAQEMPDMRDLVEFDHMMSSFFWKSRDTETVILRPVNILGRVHNAASNYLRLNPIPTLLGFDPMIQVIHELDVINAIISALRTGVRGIYNIVGPGELPVSAIIDELDVQSINIPHGIARNTLNLLWALKLTSFPPPELDFLRYVCMVDGSRANNELDFSPQKTLKETIHSVHTI